MRDAVGIDRAEHPAAAALPAGGVEAPDEVVGIRWEQALARKRLAVQVEKQVDGDVAADLQLVLLLGLGDGAAGLAFEPGPQFVHVRQLGQNEGVVRGLPEAVPEERLPVPDAGMPGLREVIETGQLIDQRLHDVLVVAQLRRLPAPGRPQPGAEHGRQGGLRDDPHAVAAADHIRHRREHFVAFLDERDIPAVPTYRSVQPPVARKQGQRRFLGAEPAVRVLRRGNVARGLCRRLGRDGRHRAGFR